MVEMREAGEPQLAGRVELAQEMRERHRIRAARHGGDDTRVSRPARSCWRIELPDAIDYRHELVGR